jgi:hypothetical protein
MREAAFLATRRSVLRLVAATAVATPAAAASLPPVAVWKDASCGCCNGWVEHMRKSGFSVTAHDSADMAEVKQANHVPEAMQSCHTALVDGYVIEGHVPADDVKRLLRERPQARGLAVPGMPASAPGMDQPGEAYSVILFGMPDGEKTYAQH